MLYNLCSLLIIKETNKQTNPQPGSWWGGVRWLSSLSPFHLGKNIRWQGSEFSRSEQTIGSNPREQWKQRRTTFSIKTHRRTGGQVPVERNPLSRGHGHRGRLAWKLWGCSITILPGKMTENLKLGSFSYPKSSECNQLYNFWTLTKVCTGEPLSWKRKKKIFWPPGKNSSNNSDWQQPHLQQNATACV
jgi:hypothetical protein